MQCDLEDPSTLPDALGRAGRVVCTVGASESTLDFSAPYKIDKVATENLIAAGMQEVGRQNTRFYQRERVTNNQRFREPTHRASSWTRSPWRNPLHMVNQKGRMLGETLNISGQGMQLIVHVLPTRSPWKTSS